METLANSSSQVPAYIYQRCPSCSKPVDMVEPPGWRYELRTDGSMVLSAHADRCMQCCVKGAAEEDFPDIRDAYAEFLRVKVWLGLPSDVTLFVLHGAGRPEGRPGTPRGQAYRLTHFGFQVRNWPEDDDEAPYFRLPLEDGTPPLEFVFPLIRVGLPDVPAYLEARWFSDSPNNSNLPVLEAVGWMRVKRRGDLDRLMKGALLIRDVVDQRGRPPDDREVRITEFRADLPDSIRKARKRRDPLPLRKGDVALEFGRSEDWLDDRLEEAGIPWSDVKRRPGGQVARRF